MATKIAVAHTRLFRNIFVCKNCGQKIRTEPLRVINKTIKCRRCQKKSFRPIKSKKK
jgi:hypothetical protein